jgi:hypothetical protein
VKIEWREVVREFRERGLIFYDKRVFQIDPAIDTASDAALAALAALVPVRDPPDRGYARMAVSLYPTGWNRAPLAERTEFDPRRAALYAELETKEGEPEGDRDRVEALIAWTTAGAPELLHATTRQGAPTRDRLRKALLGPLRERLEALRQTIDPAAVIAWVAPSGARLEMKARLALLAIADQAHIAGPGDADRLRALVAALEGAPGAPPPVLEDRPPAAEAGAAPAAGDSGERRAAEGRGWLPFLVGRKRTLARTVLRYRCAECGAEHAGPTLAEREYERRDAFVGEERGLAFFCPAGHRVARLIEEARS